MVRGRAVLVTMNARRMGYKMATELRLPQNNSVQDETINIDYNHGCPIDPRSRLLAGTALGGNSCPVAGHIGFGHQTSYCACTFGSPLTRTALSRNNARHCLVNIPLNKSEALAEE